VTNRAPFKINLDLIVASDREILMRALDPDPSKRFESCTAFMNALEQATGAVAQEAMRDLPTVLQFAKSTESAPLVAPRIEHLIAEVALDPDFPGLAAVAVPERTQQGKRTWNLRFPVRLIPGATALKINGFCEEWGGRLVKQTADEFLIQLDASGNRLPAEAFSIHRKQLEVQLKVIAYPGAVGGLGEARVLFRTVPDLGKEAVEVLDRMGPRLLESLRSYLHACHERRVDERWHAPHPLHIYPIVAGAKLGKALTAVSRNISRTGVSFLVREPLTASQVYLHWYRLPRLAPFVFLAQVARTRQVGGDDGFEVGATFSMAHS
jgi:hypothetical protein